MARMKGDVMRKAVSACSMALVPIMALGTPAWGQVPDAASASSVQPSSAQGGVEDIVVTAQRRNERQQDVPISISTVSPAQAMKAGAIGTESLGNAVPALQFSRQTGNGGVPFIRGVGSANAVAGSESPVAVYVDDVYIGAPGATLFQFNNIDSIEVLKGPQGTLFGRNATGGVVNIHTRKPSHTTELDATAGGGSYGTYFGNLYATTGLTDTVAVNFAAAGQNQTQGYGRNLVTGQDTLKGRNYGFRGQILWEPDADTSLLISGDYTHRHGDEGMSVTLAPGSVGNGRGTFTKKYGTYDTPLDYSTTTDWGVSGKLTHDFGAFNFVSITAYRHNYLTVSLDTDASPTGGNILGVHYAPTTKSLSQELQILSPKDSKFNWILGGYLYAADAKVAPHRSFGTVQAALSGALQVFSRQTLNSYAAFAEASYEFLPQTKLTAGVRYTSDDFGLHTTQLNGLNQTRAGMPAQDRSTFSKVTYRAILDHKFSNNILAYASYSTGFKSGGYNLYAPALLQPSGVLALAPAVKPEELTAYEIGLKTDLFDRHLRVNLSGYHYDYKDLQVTTVLGFTSTTLNAAKARMNGGDIDITFAPNRYVNLTGGFAYLDSKFKSFPSGPLFVPSPATCTPVPRTTGPLTGGNTTCFVSLAGNRTPRAPKFTMSLGATFTVPTEIGEMSFNATLYHNSGFYWEPDNRYRQPNYNLVNTALSWTSPSKKYELRVYAKNLLNEYYYSYFSESSFRDAGSLEMPRNFGGSMTVHF
jgi:iron complex outermembrane recepter protein